MSDPSSCQQESCITNKESKAKKEKKWRQMFRICLLALHKDRLYPERSEAQVLQLSSVDNRRAFGCVSVPLVHRTGRGRWTEAPFSRVQRRRLPACSLTLSSTPCDALPICRLFIRASTAAATRDRNKARMWATTAPFAAAHRSLCVAHPGLVTDALTRPSSRHRPAEP